MKRKSAVGACLLIALSVGLTACGSSSKKDDPGTPPGIAATDDKHPTSQQADGSSMPAGSACKLVSSTEIAAATGQHVDPRPMDTTDKGLSTCGWLFTDQAEAGIDLVVGSMTAQVRTAIDSTRGKAKRIDGLGQPAYGAEATDADDAQLFVDGGSWFLSVEAGGQELKVAQLVTIAKAALAH